MESSKERKVEFIATGIGTLLVALDFVCSAISFSHIYHHDNYVAVTVVSQSVVKQRNKTNAISMVGLFVTWFLQVGHIIASGFIVFMFDMVWLREYTSLSRIVDFVLIPWIQIRTSTPLKQYEQRKLKQQTF